MNDKDYKILKLLYSNLNSATIIGGYNSKAEDIISICIDLTRKDDPILMKDRKYVANLVKNWRNSSKKDKNSVKTNKITPISDETLQNLPKLKEQIERFLFLDVFNEILNLVDEKYVPNIKLGILQNE